MNDNFYAPREILVDGFYYEREYLIAIENQKSASLHQENVFYPQVEQVLQPTIHENQQYNNGIEVQESQNGTDIVDDELGCLLTIPSKKPQEPVPVQRQLQQPLQTAPAQQQMEPMMNYAPAHCQGQLDPIYAPLHQQYVLSPQEQHFQHQEYIGNVYEHREQPGPSRHQSRHPAATRPSPYPTSTHHTIPHTNHHQFITPPFTPPTISPTLPITQYTPIELPATSTTQCISATILARLRALTLSQSAFGRVLLAREQGTVSDYLLKHKTWGSLKKAGKAPYQRMEHWSRQPEDVQRKVGEMDHEAYCRMIGLPVIEKTKKKKEEGVKKGPRHVFNAFETSYLFEKFVGNPKPSMEEMKTIAGYLGLTEETVKNFFLNARARNK